MRLGVAAACVDGAMVPGDVDVDGGTIRAVGLQPPGSGGVALPGFVDLQVNGFAGIDFQAATVDGIHEAGSGLAATGVTAYQPTVISGPVEAMTAAVETIAHAARAGVAGPTVLGAHLEGPFLAPDRAGAHPVEHLRAPDAGLLADLRAAGPVTTVTLAPELTGAVELIRRLAADGVLVCAGHTDADADAAHRGFDAGATAVTHLFNAMRPFRPRDPGPAGVALTRDDVTVLLIADGVHLADETVRLAWRAAPGRLGLVTDAMAAAGQPEGSYRLGQLEVHTHEGTARLVDGTLAGSLATMDASVRTLHSLGVPLPEAAAAASTVPARLVGAGRHGRLAPGVRADVAVLDDRLEVTRTLARGQAVA